jgi:amino acid transporter
VLGGVVALCLLLVWLEFGLSIPVQRDLLTGSIRNVPRSGGEKNFLEYAFIRPKFLATCTYGIMFLLLGNLAGNAIYIGQYTMLAAGREIKAPRWTGDLGPPDGAVVGIAIAALTLSVLMHVFSRRGGIILNNIFAVVKVCFILTIIVLGFINLGYARAGNESPGGWHSPPNITMIQNNFKPSQTFKAREPARLQGDGPRYVS